MGQLSFKEAKISVEQKGLHTLLCCGKKNKKNKLNYCSLFPLLFNFCIRSICFVFFPPHLSILVICRNTNYMTQSLWSQEEPALNQDCTGNISKKRKSRATPSRISSKCQEAQRTASAPLWPVTPS